MNAVESLLAQHDAAFALAAVAPPGGSLVARTAGAAVLCAAVASIVWYAVAVVSAL